MERTYTVVLRREPEGSYTVLVPALPGCLTEGDTVGDSLVSAREAIECYLESLVQHGEPIPEEGPVLSFAREGLTEGFIFPVRANTRTQAAMGFRPPLDDAASHRRAVLRT